MKKRFFIVALFACLALTLGLTACGQPSAEETIREGLTSELDGLKDDKSDEFVRGLEGDAADELDQLGIDKKQFATEYLKGFTYQTGDIAVDEDAGTASVKVTLTIKSMNDVMNLWNEEYQKRLADMDTLPTEGDLYKLGGELMMAAVKSVEPKTTDIELTCKKDKNGSWQFDEQDFASKLVSLLTS